MLLSLASKSRFPKMETASGKDWLECNARTLHGGEAMDPIIVDMRGRQLSKVCAPVTRLRNKSPEKI